MSARCTNIRFNDDCTVEVSITWFGDTSHVCGDATMRRRIDGRQGYEACGDSPDQWVSGGILAYLEREGFDMKDALNEIEYVASIAVNNYSER